MEIIQAAKLIEVLSFPFPNKIGILDNNTISFLSKINKYVHTDKLLVNYDLLLIPNWLYEEVKDSAERINYFESMLEKNQTLEEIDDYEVWIKLLYEEGFKGDILKNGRTKKKCRRNIYKCNITYYYLYLFKK